MRCRWVLVLLGLFLGSGCQPRAPQPNIVLIVVDTLRADRLGAYGWSRPTSPQIDQWLAARGVLVEQALVQAPWTLPSMASMMTGLEPERLLDSKEEPWGIPAEAETLAERLQALGYQTGAVIANPTLHQGNGYAQGFDSFVTAPYELASMSKHADEVNAQALPLLANADPSRPFFLYVHYLDPHDPYDNSDIVDGKSPFFPEYTGRLRGTDVHGLYSGALQLQDPVQDAQQLGALYDAEIAYVDRFIGQLLAAIPPGEIANTLIVLTADHGEELLDHGGYKHGETLYQEQIHVPLIFRWDARIPASQRLPGPVPLLDLWPTLVAAAGDESPSPGPGINLLPHLVAARPLPPRDIFSRHLARGPLRMARVAGGHKEILFDRHAPFVPADPTDRQIWERDFARLARLERYDLRQDPQERNPQSAPSFPLPLLDHFDQTLTGLRLLAENLKPGQRLRGRLDLDGEKLEARGFFLGPDDSYQVEGTTLDFTLVGDGVAKLLLVDGDFGEIRALELEGGVVRGPEAHPLALPCPVRQVLLGPSHTLGGGAQAPTPGLRLWIRRPVAKVGSGEKDPETVRRLKALGYAG